MAKPSLFHGQQLAAAAWGRGMGTKETSQWEGGSTCRAGKLKNKRVPHTGASTVVVSRSLHHGVVGEPGVE